MSIVDDMHRRTIGFGAAVFAIFIVWFSAPASFADVQAFSYDSWHVSYEIGVDDSGHAVAEVTETIVARFPDYDQNRGIVRGLPIDYQGASTDPRNFSVTDETGTPVPFWTEEEDGFIAVFTGNDDFVHGVTTYVIKYTLSDVILARDDATADEFYWQLIDVEHTQTVDQFSAEIHFGEPLATKLNGNVRCYVGAANSQTQCEFDQSEQSFIVDPVALGPYEAVTVAIGLQPGSVVQPSVRLPNFALDGLPFYIGAASLTLAGVSRAAASKMKRRRRSAGHVIVAQYDVPDSLPPLIAVPIAELSVNPVAAELVHLAVSGATRFEDGEPKVGFFGKQHPQPLIRLVDPDQAKDPLDQKMVQQLFAEQHSGAAVIVPRKDEQFAKDMQKLAAEGQSEAIARGYFESVVSPVGRRIGRIALAFTALLVVLAIIGFITRNSDAPVFSLIVAALSGVLALGGTAKHRVHTLLGAETREYLLGVKEFIRVAEADRIRMLQSYQGAERFADGSVNTIRLYEKLLPYAMLFGMEHQWGKVLATAYAQHPNTSPNWYPASASRGFAELPSAISQYTSNLTSSASYTSSSSGGSSGGGSVGGGGGGGFSGGR